MSGAAVKEEWNGWGGPEVEQQAWAEADRLNTDVGVIFLVCISPTLVFVVY